jgi:hypothetical protein
VKVAGSAIGGRAAQTTSGLVTTGSNRSADESVIDLLRGWSVRELFDRMVDGRDLARRVRLEVNEWFGALTISSVE